MKTEIQPQQKQTYTLLKELSQVDEKEVMQYGIEQISIDSNGTSTKTHIHCISDEKEIVVNLLKIVEDQDVAPCTLEYIVEDYLVDIYSM